VGDVDPQNAQILYTGPPVTRSADGGLSWTLPAGLPPAISGLVVDPAAPSTVYALASNSPGLYRSLDRGLTWTLAGATIGNLARLAVDPRSSSTLYAAVRGSAADEVRRLPPARRGSTWRARHEWEEESLLPKGARALRNLGRAPLRAAATSPESLDDELFDRTLGAGFADGEPPQASRSGPCRRRSLRGRAGPGRDPRRDRDELSDGLKLMALRPRSDHTAGLRTPGGP
jgi:hypothetical protein